MFHYVVISRQVGRDGVHVHEFRFEPPEFAFGNFALDGNQGGPFAPKIDGAVVLVVVGVFRATTTKEVDVFGDCCDWI